MKDYKFLKWEIYDHRTRDGSEEIMLQEWHYRRDAPPIVLAEKDKVRAGR